MDTLLILTHTQTVTHIGHHERTHAHAHPTTHNTVRYASGHAHARMNETRYANPPGRQPNLCRNLSQWDEWAFFGNPQGNLESTKCTPNIYR